MPTPILGQNVWNEAIEPRGIETAKWDEPPGALCHECVIFHAVPNGWARSPSFGNELDCMGSWGRSVAGWSVTTAELTS